MPTTICSPRAHFLVGPYLAEQLVYPNDKRDGLVFFFRENVVFINQITLLQGLTRINSGITPNRKITKLKVLRSELTYVLLHLFFY
jgi:hypothetical protein